MDATQERAKALVKRMIFAEVRGAVRFGRERKKLAEFAKSLIRIVGSGRMQESS